MYICRRMKIIHIDMDAFFASVEQRDHEEWRGKAVAVGFDGPRGVVSTASYEARKYGVHSAMSIAKAKMLCPQLIIAPPRFNVYKEISEHIREIFSQYTDLIEPLSLDEAFLDVTENKKGIELAVDIAKEIKTQIHEQLNLTASAGVSYNKFLAKVASDWKKPNGICVIHPDRAIDFIDQLPIKNFWGVGPKTAKVMHHIGIFTGKQLRQCSRKHLCEVFGKAGNTYYDFARGIDYRKVEPTRIRKSVGCEQTFLKDIDNRSVILIELYHLVLELEQRIARAHFEGKTLTLKIKFSDFKQITRSTTQQHILQTKADILPLAKRLLQQTKNKKPIRLLGLSVSDAHAGEIEENTGVWYEGWLEFNER